MISETLPQARRMTVRIEICKGIKTGESCFLPASPALPAKSRSFADSESCLTLRHIAANPTILRRSDIGDFIGSRGAGRSALVRASPAILELIAGILTMNSFHSS